MTASPYKLRAAEVYSALETSPDGLSSDEVLARLELYGANQLSTPSPPSLWLKFAQHTFHPLSLILWLAGAIAILAHEPVLGIVIWSLVLVNAAFSFWREYRAEQAMLALHQILPSYARLMRDGQEVQIPTNAVVPGDVLILAEGDNIPADARVVEEFGLRTNNAVLTGETMPAHKTADASLRDGISDLERSNLVFAGTSIVSGTGRAVVFATGMSTQIGRIAHLTQTAREEPTPLQLELKRLTRQIFLAALGISAVVFTVGILEVGMPRREAFLLALGILVAAVPEGLPATITLTLALAGQRLAQRGVLVKRLSVVETLGNVSTLCTDKSGTLTQNQLTVREVWVSGHRLRVSGVGYDPHGAFTAKGESLVGVLQDDLRALLTASALCNNARLIPPTPIRPQWSSLGDQTEAALKVLAMKGGIDETVLSAEYPRVHELPFDARRKRMGTIHRYRLNGKTGPLPSRTLPLPPNEVVFVKGAPREVLQLCTHVLINGQPQPLDESLRADVLAANDAYARNAMRVLAVTRREMPPQTGVKTPERLERDLTLLGLVAMQDPPRPEVAEAIKTCREAGIRIVMVTGDYGLTAESFARRVGMLTSRNPRILTGAEVEAMDEAELQAALHEETVFARMAPEHKLRLVAGFQALGEVVAVTGDGVNDAPALRKADVGLVMGLTGTDVAKEAADIILTNDNFASFVHAVEEGRAVYDNLRKFITYILASNVPEILPFMLTAWLKIPLALTVKQILAIDLGTDMFPALGLGSEKPEPDIMQRPPRPRGQPLVDRALLIRAFLWLGLIEALLCYAGFFLVYAWGGGSIPWVLPTKVAASSLLPEQVTLLAVTVFHAGVVMAQIGNVFACRTETNRGRYLGWFSNRYLWFGVLLSVGVIFTLIYFAPLAREFDHLPLPPAFWGWLVLYAPVLYGLDSFRKGAVRWMKKKNHFVPLKEVV